MFYKSQLGQCSRQSSVSLLFSVYLFSKLLKEECLKFPSIIMALSFSLECLVIFFLLHLFWSSSWTCGIFTPFDELISLFLNIMKWPSLSLVIFFTLKRTLFDINMATPMYFNLLHLSPRVFLSYNWRLTFAHLGCAMRPFDILTYGRTFTMIRFVNSSSKSQSYLFVCVVSTFKIYARSIFQAHSTVLWSLVTVGYTRAPERILFPQTNIFLRSPTERLATTILLCFCAFVSFRFLV